MSVLVIESAYVGVKSINDLAFRAVYTTVIREVISFEAEPELLVKLRLTYTTLYHLSIYLKPISH